MSAGCLDTLSETVRLRLGRYPGERLGGISWSQMARYVHGDGSTLVRDIGRLEQRLTQDAAKRGRATAIARALGAVSE